MQPNRKITALMDGLLAAGVVARCNWQTRRDWRAGGRPDIEHLAFVGDGFAPTVSTAILIDYSGEGYGLYIEADTNSIADDVARIAKPRAQADKVKPFPSGARDLVEAMSTADLLKLIDQLAGTTYPAGVAEIKLAVSLIEKRLAVPREAEARAERAIDLLRESLNAWNDEEESVKEEHEDHIAELEAFFEEHDPAKPVAAPDDKLVVVLEGGMVQCVVGTGAMVGRTVHIIDYDTEGADDDEVSEIGQDDGTVTEAFYRTDTVCTMTISLPEVEGR